MRFLVVDDSASMRRIVTNCLKHLGYDDVVEVENGLGAFEQLLKGGVDVVVTDWNMPEMDGLTLVRKMRSDEKLRDIPVIMVTAESVKEDVIAAINAGVSNYVVRPFTPRVFREKLNKVLRREENGADGDDR